MSVGFYRDSSVPLYEIKSCRAELHSSRGHFHDEIAIALIGCGTSLVECAAGPFLAEPDTLVVFPPGVVHSCNPRTPDNWAFRMLFVPPDILPREERECFSGPAPRIIRMDREFRERIGKAFEVLSGDGGPEEKEETLFLLLELAAERSVISGETGAANAPIPESIVRTAAFLREYRHEEIPLKRLAEVSGLSRFHLVRAFRRSFDMTPHAYLMTLRIDDSKRLLREGVAISDIALAEGFCDQSHFTRVFREICGDTPARYIASERHR